MDSLVWCCVGPFALVVVAKLWLRVPRFGRTAGPIVIVGVALGCAYATVGVALDLARTDRLVGSERAAACGAPTTWMRGTVRELAREQQTPVVEIDVASARTAGLPLPQSVGPEPDASAHWTLVLRGVGARTIASYDVLPSDAFFAGGGEIGASDIVLVALRGPVDPGTTTLSAADVAAHERISLLWFWVVDDLIAIHRQDAGGTLELRESDLSLRARASRTGALFAPIQNVVADGSGGIYVLAGEPDVTLAPGAPIVVGHLARDGTWTRGEIDASLRAVSGLSGARDGGLCVWAGGQETGVVHIDGDPLAQRAWPLSQLLFDRGPALLALALAWLGLVLSVWRLWRPVHRWWAVRRGRSRAGEVHGERGAWRWVEGNEEYALHVDTWLGFDDEPKPLPAVAIDAVVKASEPAYRDSAKRAIDVRTLVRGTPAEASSFLRAHAFAPAAELGLALLFTAVPALAFALDAIAGH